MDPYSSLIGSSEDTRTSYYSYHQTELSECEYAESQTGQADTQYHYGSLEMSFLAQPSNPEYVSMDNQTATGLQHPPGTYQSENQAGHNGSPSVVDDLAVNAFAEPPNLQVPNNGWLDGSPQQFSVRIEDHDDQFVHTGYRDSHQQAQVAGLENIPHHWPVPAYGSTPPEPWNHLEASFQAPTNAQQSMHIHSSPSSQWPSYETPAQEEFPFVSSPGRTSTSNLHGWAHDTLVPQLSGAFDNNNDEARRFPGSRVALLSPNHDPGYGHANTIATAPPNRRSAGFDRSVCGNLSTNGDATSSNGVMASTSSMCSETPTCPEVMYCHHEGCPRKFTGKYRRGTFHRHMRLKHMTGPGSAEQERRYSCQVEGCGKGYMRQDALLKHLRRKHKELRIPPPVSRK